MSEPEGFLTRWSRRKREAEEPATRPDEEPVPPASSDRNDVIDQAATEPQAGEAKPPEVDLSALPSLESITAATDIRPFLLPGVPAELTRAALRRAWVADPAIRDFVGLAENAWDFTAPDTVPGFGSTVPPDVARRLVAGMLGTDEEGSRPDPLPQTETVAKPDVSTGTAPAVDADLAGQPVVTHDAGEAGNSRTVDIAMHNEEAPGEEPAPPRGAHGGALPR